MAFKTDKRSDVGKNAKPKTVSSKAQTRMNKKQRREFILMN